MKRRITQGGPIDGCAITLATVIRTQLGTLVKDQAMWIEFSSPDASGSQPGTGVVTGITLYA